MSTKPLLPLLETEGTLKSALHIQTPNLKPWGTSVFQRQGAESISGTLCSGSFQLHSRMGTRASDYTGPSPPPGSAPPLQNLCPWGPEVYPSGPVKGRGSIFSLGGLA